MLLDLYETNTGTFISATDTGSDPLVADSDGDGFEDGVEVAAGTDPNQAGSSPGQVPVLGAWTRALLIVALLAVSYALLATRRRGANRHG